LRVFVSSDMEGTAGIVDWSQCRGPGASYEAGCRLLLGEVTAAIEGCAAAGAEAVCLNDSHGAMANLPPESLPPGTRYVSGRHKPFYMMETLDSSFDAALFVSYHGSMGSNGVLSHTYNPRAVSEVKLNGVVTGEAGINGLVALGHGVPVALVTGDQVTIEEARPFFPDALGVVVKTAVTRFAADSLHPSEARRVIREGAMAALGSVRDGSVGLPRIGLPATLEISWLTADMAEMAEVLRGVERRGSRLTAITDDDPIRLFRTFTAAIAITRTVVDL
jgi:D-amino peptidase